LCEFLQDSSDAYTCGASLPAEFNLVRSGQVFVRLAISCKSKIETQYYGGDGLKGFPEVCYVCGTLANMLSAERAELLKVHKRVHPLCSSCKTKGHVFDVYGKSALSDAAEVCTLSFAIAFVCLHSHFLRLACRSAVRVAL
jgi:hypothetical protein